jgi:hypothetical protein
MRNAIILTVVLFMATATWGAPGGVPGKPPGNPGGSPGNPGGGPGGGDPGGGGPADPGGGDSDPFSVAEVSSLLVIHSASRLTSNTLVELIDESDASSGSELGLK